MSWMDEEEPVPEVKGHIVKRPPASLGPAVLRDVAAEVADDTMSVIQAALQFGTIDPAQEEPPEEWVEKYGHAKAVERLRIAKYALLGAKEAPVGLKMASAMATGIIKAKSAERNVTNELHIAKLYITVPEQQYPEVEVEEDDA